MIVGPELQSISHPEVFGGGDCIHFQPRPLPRVGVYAIRQSPILHANLLAALQGARIQEFSPQNDYLLVLNLGVAGGLLKRGRFAFCGRMMLWLKNWLDRRFIQRYQ